MDAEPAVAFFFDFVDFVSSSLSSLSDLAAAQGTGVRSFNQSETLKLKLNLVVTKCNHLFSCFLRLCLHLSGTLKLVLSSCPFPLTLIFFLFRQNLCPLRNEKQVAFKTTSCFLEMNVIFSRGQLCTFHS